MQKKIIKKKVLLALCIGSMLVIPQAYAVSADVGYQASANNETNNSSEFVKEVVSGSDTIVVGVGNRGFRNVTLSHDPVTITTNAVSATSPDVYGISNSGDITLSGDATVAVKATAAAESGYMYAYGHGIFNTNNGIVTANRDAVIKVNAIGDSGATAEGISNMGGGLGVIIGRDANITVTAVAGQRGSNDLSRSSATGIMNARIVSITRNADITVTAIGGTGETGYSAAALATGINNLLGSTSIGGTGKIAATAIGGSGAVSYAQATATGIQNTGSAVTVSGDADITAVASGGSSTLTSVENTDANAIGIANSAGTLSLEKNVSITAVATANQGRASAYAVSAEAGVVNINQSDSQRYTVKLIGDVLAGNRVFDNSGTVNLALNTSDSFLRGNVISTNGGVINLILANNAVWEPVYDNRNGTISYDNTKYSTSVNTINKLALSGGSINLSWDDITRTSFRSLNIGTLTGNGGTIKINTDLMNNTGDKVTVNTLSSAANLNIAVLYDRSLSTVTKPTTINSSGYAPVSAAGGASSFALTGVTSEYKAYSLTPYFTGTSLTRLDIGVSTNATAALNAGSGQMNQAVQDGNHLRKRLGDLRDASDSKAGLWTRVYSGEITNDKYAKVESDYKGMQLGYDTVSQVNNGRTYTGGAFSYSTADNSFSRGGGDSQSYNLALYHTWLGNDGHYYDVIAKRGRINSHYHVTDLSNNYSTADYQTGTSSLSAEYGYRKQLQNGWYLEPQAEITYGNIQGTSYTTSSGMTVRQDNINSLIGRIGLGIGKKLKSGTHLYSSLSMLHEWKGMQNVTTDTLFTSQDMSGSWYEFILGANAKLSDHSNAYINLEKLFGGHVSSNWQVNTGWRWSF